MLKFFLSTGRFLLLVNLAIFIDTGCAFDYIEVYDGPGTYSPKLGKYCGNDIPDQIRSSTNELLVIFVTDNSLQYSGFAAAYTAESRGECIIAKRTYNSVIDDLQSIKNFFSPQKDSYALEYPVTTQPVLDPSPTKNSWETS